MSIGATVLMVNSFVDDEPGPDSADGLLLEEDTDGTAFLMLEEGDYLILEA